MRFFIPLALTLSPLAAIPATTELELVNESGFNELSLTISPPTFPDNTQVSFLQSVANSPTTATLEVDPASGTATELTMSGGRIEGSDTTFSRGGFLSSYSIELTNLQGFVSTPAPPVPINPANGEFDASLLQFTIDQGDIDGSVNVFLVINATIDESFTEGENFSGQGSGTGQVTLTETGTTSLTKSFDVILTLPIDITETTESAGQQITIRAVGTLKFAGTTEVPLSEYLAWTIENSIPGASANDDSNADGVPNGIAWALGYDGTTDASISLPTASETTPGAFQIVLPAGGTAAPLSLESSTNLASWLPVTGTRLSTGINPIPPGSTGAITVSPLGANAEFIRLQSNQ